MAMLAELYVVMGREAGKALELSPGSSVTFGRALSNDVRVRDAQVSRIHCRFECTEQGLRLKDMSGNGTVVNEERLKGVEIDLKDGDKVRLGSTEIRVLIESPDEAKERDAAEAARAERSKNPSGEGPVLSESTVDDYARPANPAARQLGQPKITLAELEKIKKARARRADVPPDPSEEGPVFDEEPSAEVPIPQAPPPPPPPPVETPHLREVIPGYRIEAKLGGGGRRGTVVYKALQLSLDRPVALKVLHPPPQGTQNERDLGRFLREAAAISRLPHPNVVTVHDAGRAGDRRFIVMELLTGGSAADCLEDRKGPLPLDEALLLALDVARGLGFAHGRGIVHRSVRPANVLRDAFGTWKLVDFGLSKDVVRGGGGETNFTDAPLEAVAYLSPEQVKEGAVADARSDVYSTGALIFHALTGKPPFWAESIGDIIALIGTEPDFAPLETAAPPSLVKIVRRCLALDPDDRFPDGQTLLHEITAAQSSIRPAPRRTKT